ncbi:Lipase, secreted [Beauveria brongniartii RCEF 3172]|uniref:Lipase, secreted n=1 Tax=Beauveria brongniartii RCEF 3172 TaxID=1081107 RepID=A0A167IA38_9HYPO|nr:Lipase, secreted [Beauveria brongniartii RCEF 3172]
MVLFSRTAALIGSGLAFIVQGTLAHNTPVSDRYTEVARSKETPAQYTPVRGQETPVQYTPVRGQETPVQYKPVQSKDTPVQYKPVQSKETRVQYAPGRPKETVPQYAPIPTHTPAFNNTPIFNNTEVETPVFCNETKVGGTNDTFFRSTIPCIKRNDTTPGERELNIDGVIRPSKDSWYRAPPGHAAAPPGEVMKVRRAPGILKSVLKNLDRADQILYTTSGTYLEPTFGVSTVLVPKEWDRKYSRVVTLQVPYESANVDSSPSYALSRASGEIHYDVLDQLLGSGYHVSIPDYQGPNSAFGAGKASGFSLIDSLRGLRTIAYGRYGLDPWTIRHVAWGYSGGALATAWAFLQIKKYVGDGHQKYIDLIDNKMYSWAIGGLPVDMLHVLESVDNKVPAGYAINAISGMLHEFHLMREAVDKFGKTEGPHNISVFERVRTLSLEQSMNEYTYANLSDYFEGGIEQVTSYLREKGFHKEIQMHDPVIKKTPEWTETLFVYHGVNDNLFPVEHVDKLLHEHWCNARAFIEYMRNHEGDHEENYGNTDVVVFEWIARRFNAEFLSDAGKGLIERFPMLAREECLVRNGAHNQPLWDFEAYKKRLIEEKEAKKDKL